MHWQPTMRERHGDSGGDRRLADAAFAHEHDQSMPIRSDVIDERRKGRKINNGRFVGVGRRLRDL